MTNLTNGIERAAFGAASLVRSPMHTVNISRTTSMNFNELGKNAVALDAASRTNSLRPTLDERLSSRHIPASFDGQNVACGYQWGKRKRSIRGGSPCVAGVT
ncbi:hypothetical protein [Burkholderia territorii]|uniref:hypothetical protein n=1 Tax=Burkholderia territorii TaxID=1503055 RepID=UPI0012D976C4|nr:hypothetical protein [Burkholderia territorii]